MSRYVYKPSDAGFRAIGLGPEIRKALGEVAEAGKAYAESISQDFRRTGDYADSFEVVPLTVLWEGQHPGPRAAAQLLNSSGHAAPVEWGYAGDAAIPNSGSAHRVLGRTLEFLEGEGKA
jgi:hypothetical protein